MKTIIYFILTLVLTMPATIAFPQEDNVKTKVFLVKGTDAEATVFDTSFTLGSDYTIEQFLQEKGFDRTLIEKGNLETIEKVFTIRTGETKTYTSKDGEGQKQVEVVILQSPSSGDSSIKMPNFKIAEIQGGMPLIQADFQGADLEIIRDSITGSMVIRRKYKSSLSGDSGEETDMKTIKYYRTDKPENHIHIDSIYKFLDIKMDEVRFFRNATEEGESEERIIKIEMGTEGNMELTNIKAIVIKREGAHELPADLPKEESVIDAEENSAETLTTDRAKLPLERFKYFPNPNEGQFRLEFFLPETGQTKIEIFDLTGKQVYTKDLGNFQGAYLDNLDISQFGKGPYILKIMQNNLQHTETIIVN